MARPKTRSDTVSFRLPADIGDLFDAQAEHDGLTRHGYAEQVVRRHVQQRHAQQRIGDRP